MRIGVVSGKVLYFLQNKNFLLFPTFRTKTTKYLRSGGFFSDKFLFFEQAICDVFKKKVIFKNYRCVELKIKKVFNL